MQTRTPRTLAAAAALALIAGACTDAPTTAEAPSPGQTAYTVSPTGAVLIPNAVKYRDAGRKPARGRSASVELQTQALLAKDGTTTLEVESWSLVPDWFTGNGTIRRLQVKALDAAGRQKYVRNVNGSDLDPDDAQQSEQRVQFQGLARGDQLQVQANISDVNGTRTEVVTVMEEVTPLPDWHVTITAPSQVEAGTPVTVMAVISERNGDLGAHGSCELWVAGQIVDGVSGLWVDAGDMVTCALQWRTTRAGSYPVEVRARPYPLADWDPADNTAAMTIQVNGDSPDFYTSASFRHVRQVRTEVSSRHWRNTDTGLAGEDSSETHDEWTEQSASFYGWRPEQLGEPLRIRASQTTGGRTVHVADFTDYDTYVDGWCAGRSTGSIMLYMCSDFDGAHFFYDHAAGAVTYHGLEYSRTWDELTGTDTYVYHRNYTFESWVGEVVEPGADWTFDVRVQTADGEFAARQAIPLVPVRYETETPFSCSSWAEPWGGYSTTSCYGYRNAGEWIEVR